MAAVDYNWDGAQDLLVSQQNGKVVLVQNSKTIADGTAMHLHIVDSEGINAYYGNTVNLYNAAGAGGLADHQRPVRYRLERYLCAGEFLRADPNETYSAEIVKITNGVSDNVGAARRRATVRRATCSLPKRPPAASGTITGTGYNDTFIAEDGTYTYNGSGGWNTHSDYDTEQHRWDGRGGLP